MAMDATRLAEVMIDRIEEISEGVRNATDPLDIDAFRQGIFLAMASAIVDEIQNFAVVNTEVVTVLTVPTATALSAPPAVGTGTGAGTGTGFIT